MRFGTQIDRKTLRGVLGNSERLPGTKRPCPVAAAAKSTGETCWDCPVSDSRQWSGKTLPDDKAERAEFVRQLRWRTANPPCGPAFVRVSPRVVKDAADDVEVWLQRRRTDPSEAAA
ncbi:hypothetical protein ABZ894_00760 [Nocardia beijingensis]|uniref:hypothetical protein n=1 Tax=Nocardia beijingensis TaxID=95162 RepID=UPI0034040CC3